MTSEQILSGVNEVFVQVFEDHRLTVDARTTAQDVRGWDSLNHTILIARVQERFKVRFSLREVLRLQNVGDLCTLILEKLGG